MTDPDGLKPNLPQRHEGTKKFLNGFMVYFNSYIFKAFFVP